MGKVFLTILRMGLVSGYAVLVVLLVRRLLRRFPKRYSYLLWSVVFLRLVCPVGIESPFSLVPDVLFAGAESVGVTGDRAGGGGLEGTGTGESGKTGTKTDGASKEDAGEKGQKDDLLSIWSDQSKGSVPEILDGESENSGHKKEEAEGNSGELGENKEEPSSRKNSADAKRGAATLPKPLDLLPSGSTPEKAVSDGGRIPAFLLPVLCVIWIAGILVFWLVWACSIRRFRKRLLGAVRVEEGVYETGQAAASFVDGIFHPVIYIAPGLSGAARQYVLCHERVHVARKDPFFKAAALFLVSIYWFHPLIWLAFKKMCEDMEMSCDERVVELLGAEIKKEYSGTLLQMAQEADGVSLFAAFGGNEVKSRVKNVLSYRKPKRWLAILLLASVVAVGCGLGLNPGGKDAEASAGGSKGDALDEDQRNEGNDSAMGEDDQGEPDGKDGLGGTDGDLTGQSGAPSVVPKTDFTAEYASVLERYYTALTEQWDAGQLAEAELSILARYCYEGDALENVGFQFLDLDQDGQMELVIGAIAGDEFVDRQIFDLYQLKDGVPVHVLSGRERSRYYLCDSGDGGIVVANEGSSGAAYGEWRYSVMQDGEFSAVQIVTLQDDGWYAASGKEALSGNVQPVTEDDAAQGVIKAYEERRMKVEYLPFADLDLESGEKGREGREKAGSGIKWDKLGGKALEEQLELILNQKEIWEMTDDTLILETKYTVTDVNRNGRLELIAASCQGTGHYTYADIYEVSKDGNSLVHCEHTLKEGDSQPDIITDSAPVYFDPITLSCRYVFDDLVKDGAAYYYESKQYWEIFREGEILEGAIAYRITEYVDGEPVVTYGSGEHADVSTTNEEEYQSAADREFSDWQKATAEFCWISAQEVSGTEQTMQVWREKLQQAWEGFSIKSDDPATARTQEVFEREFLEGWSRKAAAKEYNGQEAAEWYERFCRNGLVVGEGDVISDLCLGDYDGNGVTDCFLAVLKKGSADNVSSDAAFWGCMNGEAFYCKEIVDNYAIALKVLAGDVNHDGFTELVLGGDTGGCGGGGCTIWQMLQYRGGKLVEMKMPADEDWSGERYTSGYLVSVYETKTTKTCRAVLDQDGREVFFTITGSREYAPYLDEAMPGWRDGKEPFGGNGRGYMYSGVEVIKQDGRDYLLAKECLVPCAVNGEIALACFVFDWDEDNNAYVKDFYVESC